MKSSRNSISVAGAALLLTLFAAGAAIGRALALPLPPAIVGLALVLLGLRVGVMLAALAEPPQARAGPTARGSDEHQRVLRAANG